MFKAVRDTELAAEVMGIPSTRIKVLAFVLSAFYAGIAGSLYAHSYNYISPEVFGIGQVVIILAMLLVGGVGTISGAVIGAVVLTILPEYLRFVKEYYMFVFGVAVFLIVLFMPHGIVGLGSMFRKLIQRLFKDRNVSGRP
jgi:branched-chain amino acid transport system permease protein